MTFALRFYIMVPYRVGVRHKKQLKVLVHGINASISKMIAKPVGASLLNELSMFKSRNSFNATMSLSLIIGH